jgi:hypothetical protein
MDLLIIFRFNDFSGLVFQFFYIDFSYLNYFMNSNFGFLPCHWVADETINV